MDIYAPINKHFLENKKIKISFSKVLNKKEKYFLKFLFMEYKLLEKFEKATILQDVDLNEILDVLKFSTFEQLKKFLDNLQVKKLEFSIFSNDKIVLYGRFPILVSYNFNLQEKFKMLEKIILYSHFLDLIFWFLWETRLLIIFILI